jgi:23S rRNA pseudouridine2605 synthase
VRLHKYIANCGYTSRRRAELLIQAGRVAVNGRTVTSLGATIRPGRDEVVVNGEVVSPPEPLTIAFNKPPGIITSTHDTHDRLTVMDILPRRLRLLGVLPAGRLDQDTEGLLVLTNDGDLAHRITHPRYETEKEYDVLVEGRLTPKGIGRLEKGIVLDGEMTSPSRITVRGEEAGATRATVVIHEGKKRQVRRMFEAIGAKVTSLRRVRIGGLRLGELPAGEWRELSAAEIAALTGGPRPGKAGTREASPGQSPWEDPGQSPWASPGQSPWEDPVRDSRESRPAAPPGEEPLRQRPSPPRGGRRSPPRAPGARSRSP